MTNTEINVAIAEACGWKPEAQTEWMKSIESQFFERHGVTIMDPPQYTTDLNAMHEAEKMLTHEQQRVYLNNFIWSMLHSNTTLAKWGLAHATAAQRAEAFLKCIGKWKD